MLRRLCPLALPACLSALQRKTCDTDFGGCNKLLPLRRVLEGSAPAVFTLQLAWTSHHEGPADIAATLAAVQEQVGVWLEASLRECAGKRSAWSMCLASKGTWAIPAARNCVSARLLAHPHVSPQIGLGGSSSIQCHDAQWLGSNTARQQPCRGRTSAAGR